MTRQCFESGTRNRLAKWIGAMGILGVVSIEKLMGFHLIRASTFIDWWQEKNKIK